uniref:Uncharacterized protein n=1 Tax=Meloidogyne enterolobii TaxID=390850 RepID=A0A6V7XXD3_MELEN|nr:unnamed protein product [Meloidogyne enterolobii]
MFVQLYYYEKIRGKKLKEEILKLIGNFKKNLFVKKTWKEIKRDFGELMKEIEILVKVLKMKNGSPKEIDKMLKQTVDEKVIPNEREDGIKGKINSEKFSEEIGRELQDVMNSFKNTVNQKETGDWLDIINCILPKLQVNIIKIGTFLL